MNVTVIVPVWNRCELLDPLFATLRSQTHPIAEVLVVDDGSSDESAQRAEALGARTIRLSHGGFACAVNRGMGEVRTPLAAIVNNDVALAPDWLERLAAAMSPDIWFATGRILQAARPDRIDATYDAVCRGGTAWRVGNGFRDASVFQTTRRIWSAPFTAALFRAELFQEIGRLDERFESYLEDVDFGLRCALAGCAGQYVPDAVAWHQGSATLGRWHPHVTRLISRNQVFLVAKHYPHQWLARYGWPVFVAQALWGAVAMRHGTGWSWLRGKWDGIRDWSKWRTKINGVQLAEILHNHEMEIRRVQDQCGADPYWRLYFFLTRGGAK